MSDAPRDNRSSPDEKLMPAQPQLETILQSISDGFVSYDREWRYIYVNEKAAQMLGRKKEELLGKSLFELFPENINSPIFREFKRIMQEGKPTQLDYFSPDAQRWLRTNFYPTADGMTTFFTDITPERKLEETTGYLHTLTQNMLDAVIMTNTGYIITGWNQGAEILYGWRADEVLGKPANDVLQTEIQDNPDGRQEWLRVLTTTGSWQGEVTQKRHDGSRIHVLASVARVEDAQKTVIGYIAVNHDITERKHAEEVLRNSEASLAEELTDIQLLQRISSQLISEQNAEVLYEKILDAVMSLMHADMSSLQMLYPEKNQLFLLTHRGFASESAAFWQWVGAETSSICAEALRTRKRVVAPDVETLDYIVNTPEIEFFRLSGIRGVQTTPLVTRTGSIVGMISTHWRTVHEPSERELRILDVLARQTADIIQNTQAEQLRQMRERELAVLEERQRFAREVHDGASQSIFAANVAIETVQRIWTRKPERALELLDQIHRLTTGAVAEMRMLLLELRPENVVKTKLSDLLAFHIQSVQIRRGVTVSLDIDEKYDFSLPEDVHFVFYRIAQESLNNIAKHAGAKQARIRIRPVANQVELTIVDNGNGFVARPESSGFGLTSMRERADSIGAAFRVQSRVKTGTRVKLLWNPDAIVSNTQESRLA